jgi:two-component system, chemotaxis family, CheB/CheR fusion protein
MAKTSRPRKTPKAPVSRSRKGKAAASSGGARRVLKAAGTAPAGPPQDTPFPVAGVGASAGGLEAFTALLRAMPADTGTAFVLVQHMDPTHESILPQLLAKATTMPVHQVADGMVPQPDHVYVAPANRRLTISHGVLKLTSRPEGSGRSLPIDAFFCALAEDLKNRAIGIVLSGLASDGTQGLEAIKAEGGITFAQDEKSARYSGMPASAVAAGCVDFVMSPPEIAAELVRMSRQAYIRIFQEPGEPSNEPGHGNDAIRRICATLRAATGVDFDSYKKATIQRRVARRMVLKKVEGLDSYAQLLQRDRGELDALYEDIFIHVTSFFRDPEAIQALRRIFKSGMRPSQSRGQALRVWVPGCSSGEEAYSIAMVLQEALGKNPNQPRLQVFGTDISEQSVERARVGIYPEAAMVHISAARRTRFFVKVERGYQIAKSVREICVFAKHDLTSDPPFSRLDLISCRNVLIYMGSVLQKKVLESFHYALQPGGRLFLGKSESPGAHTNLFSVEDGRNKIYSRKPGALPLRQAVAAPSSEVSRTHAVSHPAPRVFDLRSEAERILLEQFVPATLVVDPDLNIVHFYGDTSPYLAPAAGEASFHLLRMVRPELVVDLRTAIQQAKKDGISVRKGIRFKNNDGVSTVDLEVAPIKDGDSKVSDLLVVIRAGAAPAPAARKEGPGPALKGSAGAEIARLERELAATRKQIRALVEDYEAAKEEMLAVNEETLSNSEELQSANEELETAKEELQSSNEELTTLNEELQNRNLELGQLTNDLGNLLVGVDIPVVILDGDRRIRRFTQSAEQVFSLIPTDVGRPFTDIASRLDIANWEELISEAIGQQHFVERETRDRQGHWYNLRMRPYRAGEQKVGGVLIALLDIDSVKRSLDELREARDFAEAIVETVREPLLVLDAGFHVVKGTPSFYETFLVTHPETEGRSLFELGSGQWNIPRLRILMEELLSHGSRIENFEVACEFPVLGYRNLALNARLVARESKDSKTILLAIEDITVHVRAEERLRIRELTMPDAASQAILSVASDGKIVMANRMAETMFGYSREELLEMPLEALVPERLRQVHAAHMAGYFAAPKFRPMGHGPALTGRRKDGSEFPIAIGLSHTHTKAGMLAVAFVTDLTGPRQAEAALRDSEERFSLFMSHLPAAAFMKDAEGRYVYVNPGFGKLASLPPARCVGASDSDFWPGSAEGLRALDQRVIRTGRAATSEDARTAEGKHRYFQTVRFPIPNPIGQTPLVAGIAVEITERKVAEQERQSLLARLASAQEEERWRISRELHDDLTQRLGGLAMDLGSLVGERSASSTLLKNRLRSLQQRVVRAAEVSRHIAHKLHPSELDDLGLVAALRSYSEDFARRESIEIGFASRNVPKELKREIASCLYQVTQESLANISKHAGAKSASVHLDGTADRIRIRVKDAGIGFRSELPASKLGLGLLSMKERVELLHGTFGVLSRPGHGTEITVEIPLEAR